MGKKFLLILLILILFYFYPLLLWGWIKVNLKKSEKNFLFDKIKEVSKVEEDIGSSYFNPYPNEIINNFDITNIEDSNVCYEYPKNFVSNSPAQNTINFPCEPTFDDWIDDLYQYGSYCSNDLRVNVGDMWVWVKNDGSVELDADNYFDSGSGDCGWKKNLGKMPCLATGENPFSLYIYIANWWVIEESSSSINPEVEVWGHLEVHEHPGTSCDGFGTPSREAQDWTYFNAGKVTRQAYCEGNADCGLTSTYQTEGYSDCNIPFHLPDVLFHNPGEPCAGNWEPYYYLIKMEVWAHKQSDNSWYYSSDEGCFIVYWL